MGYPPIPYYLMKTIFLNRKKYTFAIIIITIVLFIPFPCLQLRNLKTGELLEVFSIRSGEEFSVMYIHSVMLTPVYEKYIIDNDSSILLTETIFQSYGAGLPATTPYDFEIIKEGFRIYNINEKYSTIVYRTGAIPPSHTMILRGKEYSFLDFSKPMTPVEFSYGNILLWELFFRRY